MPALGRKPRLTPRLARPLHAQICLSESDIAQKIVPSSVVNPSSTSVAMPQWNTQDQKIGEQFGFWREVLCEAFIALNSTRDFTGGFQAHVVSNLVADVNVCRLVTDEHDILRTRHEISRMSRDCFFVNMQIAGNVHVEHIGRNIQVCPNQFYVVDAAEPYNLAYRQAGGNVRTFSFRIPKSLLTPLLPEPEKSLGVRVAPDTAMGALAVDFLGSLALRSDNIPVAAQPAMARMAADLIALSLNPQENHSASVLESKRKALLHSILAYIDQNSINPGLGVELVCRRFGLSARTLHRLFEAEGLTFAQVVTIRRLRRCAETMCDHPDVSIASIAFANGFGDLSSFNRQFRKHFDLAPREYRGKMVAEQRTSRNQ